MINQLGSRYPIVAMAMNRLSDVKLACAVEQAGAIPSLSVYNYYTDPKTWDVAWLRRELETYMKITNGANIMLSVGIKELLDPNIQQVIKDYRIKLIELIPDSPSFAREMAPAQPRALFSMKRDDSISASPWEKIAPPSSSA